MIKKLILGTASVLALGIGGAALDLVAANDVPNASGTVSATSETSHHWLNTAKLSRDDVRWAQLNLRNRGLYKGSLDGVIGPETGRALAIFQRSKGLARTGTLDQRTADALIGNADIGYGSSMPPNSASAGPPTTSSGISDFGSPARQK
jgi:peptidoglycan hydrolase-like protein with peptidoglycan-binding domain